MSRKHNEIDGTAKRSSQGKEAVAPETSLHRELKERYGPGTGGEWGQEVGARGVPGRRGRGGDGMLVEVQVGGRSARSGEAREVLTGVERQGGQAGGGLARRVVPQAGDGETGAGNLVRAAQPEAGHDRRRLRRPDRAGEGLPAPEPADRRARRRGRRGARRQASAAGLLGGRPPAPAGRWSRRSPLRDAADLSGSAPGAVSDAARSRPTSWRPRALGRPLDFAQRVAYCLRLTGAAATVGKEGNRARAYVQAGPPAWSPQGGGLIQS